MNVNLQPFFFVWIALAVVVLALAVRRKVVANHVDSGLQHVMDGGVAPLEMQKLDHIDKWGKGLTIFVLIYGVVLGAIFLYQGWSRTPGIGV